MIAPVAEVVVRRRVVGMGDLLVSGDPTEVLITYALGSCLGVAVYDPVALVGGLLHVMLPRSSVSAAKARARPGMFVDTGLPLLFKECYRLGAEKSRMIVKVAGGAARNDGMAEDRFQIGKRNFVGVREMLWKNGVMLSAHDVGGSEHRTMSMAIGSGAVLLRSSDWERTL